MANKAFQPPRLLSIGLGIALFLLFLIVMCSLTQGVKWAGSVLLFLPDRLGLVQTVRPAEVFAFEMTHSPAEVKIARAGLYQVYTSDYDLLVISDQLAQSGSPPWMTVSNAGSGKAVQVSHVTRGLLPYDTPYAPGRPVIELTIPEAGEYLLVCPTRQAEIAMVPDYMTGHEGVIYASFAVQLLILALPLAILLYRREQRTWQQSHEERVRSIAQFEKIRRLARGEDAEKRGPDGPPPQS
jgi:hypothetical protein